MLISQSQNLGFLVIFLFLEMYDMNLSKVALLNFTLTLTVVKLGCV